jgi:hypothetical protein
MECLHYSEEVSQSQKGLQDGTGRVISEIFSLWEDSEQVYCLSSELPPKPTGVGLRLQES